MARRNEAQKIKRGEKRRAAKAERVKDRCAPICVECGELATEVVGGEEIYPHRRDLHYLRFLRCACGAYVGFHKGTDIPLGRPAGPATIKARSAAHRAFDPLWEAKMRGAGISKGEARGRAYGWLAKALGIEPGDCHIGMMDRATALRVVEVVEAARAELRAAKQTEDA